jgi:cell division protein FtsL
MKRAILVIIVLALPVFMCLEVWEIIRYTELQKEIVTLEKVQEEWLEKNKKVLAAIAVLKSPERISTLADVELGLEMITPEKIMEIEVTR